MIREINQLGGSQNVHIKRLFLYRDCKLRKMRNILALLVVIALSSSVSAEVECPFGLVNDTYPGDCGRYIDINGDGICDYSQPEPSSAAVPAGETPMLSASQSVHPQSLFDRYHFF